MTLPDALSWGASILSLTSTWFYGSKSKWAPYIGLTSQVPWFALSWVTGLHGLFLSNFVFAAIHIRNAYRWRST